MSRGVRENTWSHPLVDQGVRWCDDREPVLSGRTRNARDCSAGPPLISARAETATA
ncbi:hypothetical protein ACSCB1_03695 [Streptomyces europaeiscabiei]|uniref:Transposase n=1 Tax=Streptomyces europaeiscabiei TaxID=146819 RepID=A0ABU4NIF0_9ACTN|nr:hypothetical protein [Streptomyces europaeiscabiei]MDX2768053.1 hypothetical protein [Streptomyces europaeiscabiei]MDX3545779.1 hypothetical protein [Streptomyces europaeiscabiei]MDX3554823.1 hypothetical protein [Streptomyces europaeiscabiei]MDX3673421.1 hypothetical protein [Streptomyces europaeiscabiei]MDX3702910.1 hypothetical protein [Streptomyces europaeiscabiei]